MAVTTIDLGEIGSKVDPLDLMPVGYIYMSFDPTSPAELFGGTWVQLTSGVLRAANDTQTGGADTRSLVVGNIPSHSHQQFGSLGVSQVGVGSEQVYVVWGNTNGDVVSTYTTGYGNSFNILPAYQDVYAWRRTA